MAIAGRVAIVPKGEWSQSVTYDKLDLVTHNGNTFIAYKSSVGVTPVDGDTWMLVMQGIDPQDIENIIDGTTPVGDSNKLGGKEAIEYALAEHIKKNSIWTELTEGFDLNNAFGKYRTASDTVMVTLLNLPSAWTMGELTVEWIPFITSNTYGVQVLTYKVSTMVSVYRRVKHSATWGEWIKDFDSTGGKLANATHAILDLENTADTPSFISFTGKGTTHGSLGFHPAFGTDPQVILGSNFYSLLHTGNKPTGSYTGTGASRTVNTGGIGGVCII